MLACCTFGVLSTKRKSIVSEILFHLKLGTLAPSSGVPFWTYSSDTPFPVVWSSKDLNSQDRKDQRFQHYGFFQTYCSVLWGLPICAQSRYFRNQEKNSFFKCYSRHKPKIRKKLIFHDTKKERNFPMPFLRIYPLENLYMHIYIYMYIYIFFFSSRCIYSF